jgi:hypothetical protein
MFIKIENNEPVGFPISDENLRLLVPSNVSLPRYPVTADVLEFGFAVYEFAQVPEPALTDFKVVEEGTPTWANDEVRGDYITQVWAVRDMDEAEKAAATEQQWIRVRSERNAKLSACDWTQLDDTPLTNTEKQAWGAYRQALRDITTQTNPFAIIWPAAPGA